MNTDPNAFLLGNAGAPAAKFEHIGDSVTGTIDATEVRQQTDIQSGVLKTWPDGNPMMQLVVTLRTNLRDGSVEDDDGTRRLFIKGKSLTNAVREAVKGAGAPGLEIGGTLTVTFIGEEPAKTRGFNPAKLYAATYQRPVAGMESFFPAEDKPATGAVNDGDQAAYAKLLAQGVPAKDITPALLKAIQAASA